MTIGRRTNQAEREKLKALTKRTIQMAGGQEYAAHITRVSRKTLSDYGNVGSEKLVDVFMPLDVLADFIKDAAESDDVPPVLEMLCQLAGGRFVPSHKGGALGQLDDIISELNIFRENFEKNEVVE